MKNSKNIILAGIMASVLSACGTTSTSSGTTDTSVPTLKTISPLSAYRLASGKKDFSGTATDVWETGKVTQFTLETDVKKLTIDKQLSAISAGFLKIDGEVDAVTGFTASPETIPASGSIVSLIKDQELNIAQTAGDATTGTINLQGLVFVDVAKVDVNGAAATVINLSNVVAQKGGTLNITGSTATLDTVDLTDVKITVDGGTLVFGKAAVNADLSLQYGELKGKSTIDDSKDSGVTIANGYTLVINSKDATINTITTKTLINNGTLTVTQGKLTGDFVNGTAAVDEVKDVTGAITTPAVAAVSGTTTWNAGAITGTVKNHAGNITFSDAVVAKAWTDAGTDAVKITAFFTTPTAPTTTIAGAITNDAKAEIDFNGGSAVSTVKNDGTFKFSAGNITGVVTNTGDFTISDAAYATTLAAANALTDATAKTATLAALNGKELTTAGDVINTGTFTVQGGKVGNFTNNDGGTFKYDSTANATVGDLTGVDATTGTSAGNNFAFKTGKTLTTGVVTLTANTNLTFVLGDGGTVATSAVAGDITTAANAATTIPLIDAGASAANLNAKSIIFKASKAIAANTVFKLATTSGIVTPTAAMSPADANSVVSLDTTLAGSTVDKTTTTAGGKLTDWIDLTVSADAHNLILTVLKAVAAPATPAAVSKFSGKGLSFTSRSSMASGFMNQTFSADMNASVSKFGVVSMTTSNDETANGKSDFVGMSVAASKDLSFASYVNYNAQTKTVSEFGAFSLSKVAGLDVMNSVSYGANVDATMADFAMNTKSFVAGTKVSKSFSNAGLTFTPNMFFGVGQMIENTSSFKQMNISADSSAALGSFGFDVAHSFNIDAVAAQAFASVSYTSEFGARSFSIDGDKGALNTQTASALFGFKANIDANSNLYATTQIEKTGEVVDHKFALGMNVKF